MSDVELISYLVGALMVAYFAGYQCGKYAKILKDLGR